MMIWRGAKSLSKQHALLGHIISRTKIDCKIIRDACLNKLFRGKMKVED